MKKRNTITINNLDNIQPLTKFPSNFDIAVELVNMNERLYQSELKKAKELRKKLKHAQQEINVLRDIAERIFQAGYSIGGDRRLPETFMDWASDELKKLDAIRKGGKV